MAINLAQAQIHADDTEVGWLGRGGKPWRLWLATGELIVQTRLTGINFKHKVQCAVPSTR